uniref:Uncharacterized protein n=1 Tax=Zea mays TaxID=4577 RepID=A0A804MTN6_MAIZE
MDHRYKTTKQKLMQRIVRSSQCILLTKPKGKKLVGMKTIAEQRRPARRCPLVNRDQSNPSDDITRALSAAAGQVPVRPDELLPEARQVQPHVLPVQVHLLGHVPAALRHAGGVRQHGVAGGVLAGQRALLGEDPVPDVAQPHPRRGLAVVGAGRPVRAQGHHLDEHLPRPHEQEVRHGGAVHADHGVAAVQLPVYLAQLRRALGPDHAHVEPDVRGQKSPMLFPSGVLAGSTVSSPWMRRPAINSGKQCTRRSAAKSIGGNADSCDTTSPYLVIHQSWYSRITSTTRRRRWCAVTNSGRIPSLNSWYTLPVYPPVEKSTAGASCRTSHLVDRRHHVRLPLARVRTYPLLLLRRRRAVAGGHELERRARRVHAHVPLREADVRALRRAVAAEAVVPHGRARLGHPATHGGGRRRCRCRCRRAAFVAMHEGEEGHGRHEQRPHAEEGEEDVDSVLLLLLHHGRRENVSRMTMRKGAG